jgi:hypothetical protein
MVMFITLTIVTHLPHNGTFGLTQRFMPFAAIFVYIRLGVLL